jgi:hypothetical protein
MIVVRGGERLRDGQSVSWKEDEKPEEKTGEEPADSNDTSAG